MLKDVDSQKLTIDDVRDKLNNRYERIDEREKGGMNTEVALAAFKGNCYKCGKYGHCGRECKTEDDKKGSSSRHLGDNVIIVIVVKAWGHKQYKYKCELRKSHLQDREQSKMARGLGVEYDTDNESIDELGF